MLYFEFFVCGLIECECFFECFYECEFYCFFNVKMFGWVDVFVLNFFECMCFVGGLVYLFCVEGGGVSVFICMYVGIVFILMCEVSVDFEFECGWLFFDDLFEMLCE